MVDCEITLSYDELLRRLFIEWWITLCCVFNEIGGDFVGNARWFGIWLVDVLCEVGVYFGAD